ncbi:hypothetical protein POM88_004495 [Heracleum sosnowskyi]|uniref:Uncharacterized protein n=1 Tax=Heracleum sosnowskyi TaxID=360622 RepID=A0AAD8JN16_9APIA|nr:hypothetical protein POM88_004495 [Heracleum sosnowskyi]
MLATLQATSTNEVDSTLQEMMYSDSLSYSGAQYSWNAKYCDTPVGRYCKRISSSSINSEKRLCSNPELTCFRIEEDSCVDEHKNSDYNDDHIQEDIGLAETNSCTNGEPLSETIEVFSNPPAAKKLCQIGGIHPSNAEFQSSVKQRLRNHCSNNKSKNWGKENQLSSVGANSIKVGESLHNRFSKAKLSSTRSIKRGTQRLSEKLPMKYVTIVLDGFSSSESCSIEDSKKEADLAARKRVREEEVKKEKERKRKRIGVGLQTHRAQEKKTFAGKGEKEKQCGNMGKSTNIRKGSDNRTAKGQHWDKVSRGGNTLKKPESQTEFKTTRSYIQEVSTVPEICETLGNCDGSTKNRMRCLRISTHDEEEEEDEVPTKEFIPSWASKNCVALVLASQQQIDPSQRKLLQLVFCHLIVCMFFSASHSVILQHTSHSVSFAILKWRMLPKNCFHFGTWIFPIDMINVIGGRVLSLQSRHVYELCMKDSELAWVLHLAMLLFKSTNT